MTTPLRYRITHVTSYRYSSSVAVCHNQLRMLPRHFAQVQLHDCKVAITPVPTWRAQHTDYFKNEVLTFAIESLHKQLKVEVVSEVTVAPPPGLVEQPIAWQAVMKELADSSDAATLAAKEFCYESPMIPVRPAFAEYAEPSFAANADFIDAVVDLTKRMNADFRYDTSATNVDTSTADAFALRAGVCQDFAHVQIACLRSLGFAARYVSGYLRTIPKAGQERLIGADESHAWISVYGGAELGWIDCDPTNACLVKADHVPICIGRDYRDVSPMRGVAIGGGQTSLSVSVDVALLS